MHYPVLLKESVDGLNIQSNGTYIDGTFGRGGHSKAILNKLDDRGSLIAFDRDPDSISYADKFFCHKNFTIVHSLFSSIYLFCRSNNLLGKINGILLDLGVSSPQLDVPERGFSFSKLGPLDMRMNPAEGVPARRVLEMLTEQELSNVFRNFGEERYSRKISKAIKRGLLLSKTFDTTFDLADLVIKTVGKGGKKHPATRIFQALRIYVNQELAEIHNILAKVYEILAPKGRLSIITFHSLEDRIVKKFMVNMTSMNCSSDIPRLLPVVDKKIPLMRWVVKKARAQTNELRENIRSRSGLLRVVEKI